MPSLFTERSDGESEQSFQSNVNSNLTIEDCTYNTNRCDMTKRKPEVQDSTGQNATVTAFSTHLW